MNRLLLILLIITLVAAICDAEPVKTPAPRANDPLSACRYALDSCDGLVKAEDARAVVLKDSLRNCQKEASKGSSEVHPVLWVVGGVLLGIVLGNTMRGWR